jgi:hypothetical protein
MPVRRNQGHPQPRRLGVVNVIAREAYYDAIRDLGIARDTLQVQIGAFLASVQEARGSLLRRAPKMIECFDAAANLFMEHLMDDLLGNQTTPE